MNDIVTIVDKYMAKFGGLNRLVDSIASSLLSGRIALAGGGGCNTSRCDPGCGYTGNCYGQSNICKGHKLYRSCDALCNCGSWIWSCDECCYGC